MGQSQRVGTGVSPVNHVQDARHNQAGPSPTRPNFLTRDQRACYTSVFRLLLARSSQTAIPGEKGRAFCDRTNDSTRFAQPH